MPWQKKFFPFDVPHCFVWKKTGISIPEITDLAAMKAYALGRRSKWKDYVDIYFFLESGLYLNEIIKRAETLFGANFNSKLFREQLCYFNDIDFTETIEYRCKNVTDYEIQNRLENEAVNFD